MDIKRPQSMPSSLNLACQAQNNTWWHNNVYVKCQLALKGQDSPMHVVLSDFKKKIHFKVIRNPGDLVQLIHELKESAKKVRLYDEMFPSLGLGLLHWRTYSLCIVMYCRMCSCFFSIIEPVHIFHGKFMVSAAQ